MRRTSNAERRRVLLVLVGRAGKWQDAEEIGNAAHVSTAQAFSICKELHRDYSAIVHRHRSNPAGGKMRRAGCAQIMFSGVDSDEARVMLNRWSKTT